MLSQEAALKHLKEKGSAKVVGLISDTHVPVRAREIPKKVFEVFEKWTTLSMLATWWA